MKNNSNYNRCRRIAGIKAMTACLLALASLSLVLTGCVADNDANSKSISQYTDKDVQSYGDLFEVFWNVMNQRYCDWNEQPGVASLDWDNVYSEYKPRFDSLKTFKATSEFTQTEIQDDNAKAKQYFKEIVGKLIDQHFQLKVTLPISHTATETVSFMSTLREKSTYLPLDYRLKYAHDKLRNNGTAFCDSIELNGYSFCIVGGFLKSNPDIYYLGFNGFDLSTTCVYNYEKEYLPTDTANRYHLNQQKIATAVNENVASEARRTKVMSEAVAVLNSIDKCLASGNVTEACKKMVAYSNGGDYYGLADCAQRAYNGTPSILSDLPLSKNVNDISNAIYTQLGEESGCKVICKESLFRQWFSKALAEYLLYEREFYYFWYDLAYTCFCPSIEHYRRYFIDPLSEGKIKKLILDVRGNGGGYVLDTRYLTDYLVSHTAIYAYTRKKEDNNPYSYSPWIPQQVSVTSKSLGRDIPTAILLDYGSASMSEMTTLMLKSQGDHVKTVGRNSAGAQCMLHENNSEYNGGWIGNVTSYLNFYMPVLTSKDANGNLLEVVGITPDYLVEEMTQEEIYNIVHNTNNAKDRDMEKAIEVLQ